MTQDTALAAACGLYCGDCEHIGDKCDGCSQVAGKPFWTTQFGVEVCPLYDCSVNQKRLEHCGLCEDFPCETFNSLRDPTLSDEEAEKALQKRGRDLLLRKELGTEAWLEKRVK
jgi:hypothetical protein